MSRNKGKGYQMMPQKQVVQHKQNSPMISNSLLDVMEDKREFESLLHYQYKNINLIDEVRRSISEIQLIRQRPLICYVANVVKPIRGSISIDDSDDLPFLEMLNSIPSSNENLDIVLVTPGGYAQQVVRFVNKLRPRFKNVTFILLNKCMSAGTIFVMSGNDIIMKEDSCIGPIDPQTSLKNGGLAPAQSILTLVEDIRRKGEEKIKAGERPSWTDITILNGIDPKELGNAISASDYSINLVKDYLINYKFRDWNIHSDGTTQVSEDEKRQRAKEIAQFLCAHNQWKSHGHSISREVAWSECRLKITHSESIEGLDRAMRRMWALFYWIFENTSATKFFVSDNYSIIRNGKHE